MTPQLETVDKRCGTVKDFNGFHTLTLFVRFPGKVQLARACVRFFPGLSPAHSQDEPLKKVKEIFEQSQLSQKIKGMLNIPGPQYCNMNMA